MLVAANVFFEIYTAPYLLTSILNILKTIYSCDQMHRRAPAIAKQISL